MASAFELTRPATSAAAGREILDYGRKYLNQGAGVLFDEPLETLADLGGHHGVT